MDKYKGKPVEYLGDAVYALYDVSGAVWLHTTNHAEPIDKIYLEPEVLDGLNRFVKRCKEKESTDAA